MPAELPGSRTRAGLLDVVLAEQARRTRPRTPRGRARRHRRGRRSRSPLTVPSSSLVTKTRSRMRMMPAVDEVDEEREGLAGHLAAGKLHHDVVDRAHLVKVVGHALLLEDSDGGSGRPPRSDPRQPRPRVASPVACEDGRGGQGLMSEPWTVSARITTIPSEIMTRERMRVGAHEGEAADEADHSHQHAHRSRPRLAGEHAQAGHDEDRSPSRCTQPHAVRLMSVTGPCPTAGK